MACAGHVLGMCRACAGHVLGMCMCLACALCARLQQRARLAALAVGGGARAHELGGGEEHRELSRRAHAAGQLGRAQPPQPRHLVVHLLLELQRGRLVELAGRRRLRLRLLRRSLAPPGIGRGPLRRGALRPSVGIAAEVLEAPLLRLSRRVLLLERRGELRRWLHLNRVARVVSPGRRWPPGPLRARPRAEGPRQHQAEGPFPSAAEGCAHAHRAAAEPRAATSER